VAEPAHGLTAIHVIMLTIRREAPRFYNSGPRHAGHLPKLRDMEQCSASLQISRTKNFRPMLLFKLFFSNQADHQ
jgi:hypothetical protein